MQNVQDITVAQVHSVYSGKPGCLCGCRGKYYVAPEHRELVAERRGYRVDEDEVSARMVAKVLRLLQADAGAKLGEGFDSDEFVLSAIVGGRQYIAYVLGNIRACGLVDGEDDGMRITARTPGGRNGRNVGMIDFY